MVLYSCSLMYIFLGIFSYIVRMQFSSLMYLTLIQYYIMIYIPILSVGTVIFFFLKPPIQNQTYLSGIVFSCHVFLTCFNLEYFHRLLLSLMMLIYFKKIVLPFPALLKNKTFTMQVLSDVSHDQLEDVNFQVEYHIGNVWSFSGFCIWRHIMYIDLLLEMLIFITWVRCCPILHCTITLFIPLQLINSVGRYFQTKCKYCAASQNSLQILNHLISFAIEQNSAIKKE